MGTVFAIKRYAIHDGPNIRTTVFLKGCPLKCRWCHNPEGMDSNVTMVWSKGKCVGCGECVKECQQGSLSADNEGVDRDVNLCQGCLVCVESCPALAHEATGRHADAVEIVSEIKKDIPFFDETGGGVTFSGGEPLMQPEFLLELLDLCGNLGIHRAVDTCAFASTDLLLRVADCCELFLIDLKHMDSDKHKRYTGVANDLILNNIIALAEKDCAMTIRIPLIEGVNSDDENIHRSGLFLAALPIPVHVDLLPYHSIAGAKYRKLGLDDPGSHFTSISAERVAACKKILTEMNLDVEIGG